MHYSGQMTIGGQLESLLLRPDLNPCQPSFEPQSPLVCAVHSCNVVHYYLIKGYKGGGGLDRSLEVYENIEKIFEIHERHLHVKAYI